MKTKQNIIHSVSVAKKRKSCSNPVVNHKMIKYLQCFAVKRNVNNDCTSLATLYFNALLMYRMCNITIAILFQKYSEIIFISKKKKKLPHTNQF